VHHPRPNLLYNKLGQIIVGLKAPADIFSRLLSIEVARLVP
jgi:hypothetical protein